MNLLRRFKPLHRLSLVLFAAVFLVAPSLAAPAEVSLTGTRSQFFQNEAIEFAVGSGAATTLSLRHLDGSTLSVALPASSTSRLVTIKPEALKPGEYSATAGAQSVAFGVQRDAHPNAFFTAQWVNHGASKENALAKSGWMNFNSDYVSLNPRAPAEGDLADAYVASRMKPYALTVLGGGHQLDLETANDWGDAAVQRAIVWRLQLAALSNRIYPLAGLHAFDEPGLTWWPAPTGKINDKGEVQNELSPFAIPHQLEEFQKITGKKIPFASFPQAAPQYAPMMNDWLDFTEMRMKYLEQAWNADVWGAHSVHPAFQNINQVSSSYAPGDTTDGVDARQNRPYEIISGHGGYSDLAFGIWQPLQSAESFWGFSQDKPHYYLPMWYTHTWPTIRAAIWMSWTTKLDGLLYTPEQDFAMNNGDFGFNGTNTIFEIAEINRKLALVGGVMNGLKKTPVSVAVLHSSRQAAWDIATQNFPAMTKDAGVPMYRSPHNDAVTLTFMRCVDAGIVPNWIDESEASEKGAQFLKQWKVIFLPGLATAAPAFQKALEEYVASGGKLIQNKGDALIIAGATIADHTFGNPAQYYTEKNPTGSTTVESYRDLAYRRWNASFAPNFRQDLEKWLGAQPYQSSNREVLVGVHRAGEATYLLMANGALSQDDPRGLKHELIPASTTIKVPGGGVVYDLFNGGVVPISNGQANLKLPAGDGACWVRLPRAPGAIRVAARLGQTNALQIDVSREGVGLLPFRLRILDPAGNQMDEWYRATSPQKSGTMTSWSTRYPLGANAANGQWTIEVSEWMTNTQATAKVAVKPVVKGAWSTLDAGDVSIYFDDAQRIRDLFAGKAGEPPYEKLNWDAKRVFGLDAKKFAVFGDAPNAEKIAAALRGKGMSVEVNPKYEIMPFVREPYRGGAGPIFREQNFENIYAHAIVLPGHDLIKQSWNRGHINRPVTSTFPGPNRAFIQWGSSAYQAGWQNVWVQGDEAVGVKWLLDAINGAPENNSTNNSTRDLSATIQAVAAKKNPLPQLSVATQIKTDDTPVGVASGKDGMLYTLLADGEVSSRDATGKVLWTRDVLLEGAALALSPNGARLAVAGYPGLLVLDAKTGKELGGHRAAPDASGELWHRANRVQCAAWNDASTLVAGGWLNINAEKTLPPILLDADGKELPSPNINGGVMGAAWLPNSDTLILGADKLTALDARSNRVLWSAEVKGAQSFVFHSDGKTVACGGWGKRVAVVETATGKVLRAADFDAVIGGAAWLPNGDLAVAVWGGTHPLYVWKAGVEKPQTLFGDRFGFQNVAYSAAARGLVAAEQGGTIWILNADGTPRAELDENAGTTPYKWQLRGSDLWLARMDHRVQRIVIGK